MSSHLFGECQDISLEEWICANEKLGCPSGIDKFESGHERY